MGNAHPEHLWQAPGGTWYLNIGVPKKYREAVGRKTYMKSLRTKDRDEAKLLKHAAMVAAQDYFKRRQSGRPITIEEIDHAKARAVYELFQTRSLAELEVYGSMAVTIGKFADYHEKQARKIIADTGAKTTPRTVKRLALALADADREAWERYQKGWKPLPPEKAVRRGAGDGLTVAAAVEAYFDDARKRGRWTGKTRQLYKACAGRFAEHAGAEKALRGIAKGDAVAYLDALPERQATATRNRHVMAVRGLFTWAIDREYHDGPNPFDRLSRAESKRERQQSHWLPMTTEELRKITERPVVRPNRHTWRTARQWVVWIVLYSGLRPDEVCELGTSNVRAERGVTFFDITASKSAAGVRQVPVHDALIELGFLDYVAGLPEGPLWPGLAPHGYDKRRAGTLSKLFPKWKRDRGVTRPKTAFYSLRKNAVTALREADVPQADVAAVIGHEVGFTWEVYAPTGLTLRRKREIVNAIAYPGLSLD